MNYIPLDALGTGACFKITLMTISSFFAKLEVDMYTKVAVTSMKKWQSDGKLPGFLMNLQSSIICF